MKDGFQHLYYEGDKMKNEVSEKGKENNKDKGGNTFIYAAILFGAIVITGLIALAFIVLDMF
jgi:hypothetical protein